MSKLRSFVKFLLDFPTTEFDDSLIMFYPYTPKGTVTVEDRAVHYFLLYMTKDIGGDDSDDEGEETPKRRKRRNPETWHFITDLNVRLPLCPRPNARN